MIIMIKEAEMMIMLRCDVATRHSWRASLINAEVYFILLIISHVGDAGATSTELQNIQVDQVDEEE